MSDSVTPPKSASSTIKKKIDLDCEEDGKASKMITPKKLAEDGYTIMNVRKTQIEVNNKTFAAKAPIDRRAIGIRGWEKMPHDELVAKMNYDEPYTLGFGIRCGEQGNNKLICSLDFDCCKKIKDGYTDCDETLKLFDDYRDTVGDEVGMFSSSTSGNTNVLIDYTDAPLLKEKIKSLGKDKICRKGCGLELMINHNQVIPPTATKCKRSGEMGNPRAFYTNSPFKVVTDDDPAAQFIMNYIKTCGIEKPAKKTTKKLVLKQAVPKEEGNKADTFAKKVVNLIKPEIIDDMSNFRRIVWAMKYEGFSLEDVKKVAKKSQHYEEETFDDWFASTKLWDSKSNKNPCKLGTLIHFAKMSDAPKFYDLHIQYRSSHEMSKSDIALASIYLEILGDNLFYQDKNLYIYIDGEWYCDTEGHFVKRNFLKEMKIYYQKLKDEVNKQINEIENEEGKEDETEELLKQIEEIKSCSSYIEKVNTLNNVISAIKTLMATLKEEIKFDTNEEQLYNIHFRNGVFDLNTNTFRQRTKDDYVSMVLSWDYEPEIITEEAREELQDCFTKIEPCPERRKCLLSYLAYSLTGDCSKQKYLNLIGYTAANGKSHTFKMMSKCFEFYTKKLSSDIFNIGNEKRHKQIIHLYKNPVRFAFIEELDNKKKLDAEYMKDIVDGSKVPVDVMYGTSVEVALQCKIITSSNGDPNIKMDDAILRRIVNLYLKSQFVETDADDWENRKFVRKDGAEKMFDCPIMKNAVFELLTRPKYKEFVVPECVKSDTKDTADILNDFKDRFEAYYDITKNPEDAVNKNDFMEVLKISKTDLKKTISEMRQLGVDYNKDKKKNKVKGCFIGIKEITEYQGED